MNLKLYTKLNCPQCDATKRSLEKNKIEYETISLDQNPEALEFVLSLGHRSAPVVFIDNDNHWSGFRPDLISKNKEN